ELGSPQSNGCLLPGDEIRPRDAERIGLALEVVRDADLEERAADLARRIAMIPANQLIMLKALCNQPAEAMGLAASRRLGTIFDGVARHTQEGLDFVRSEERR